MENLSENCNKEFSATSHGKGAVDGIFGNVISSVGSKGYDSISVQDSLNFAEAATQLAINYSWHT